MRRRVDRRAFVRATCAGALAVAALCGTARAPARGEGLTKLRVGVLRLSSSAPVFIAFDRGYFRQRGLDVELRFFDAAQPVAVAVAAGDIDIGVTAFTGGLFNLAGKRALKVVAGQSREAQGFPLIAYLAHPRAFDAGLRAPKDLPGHRVGMTQVGSSFHYSVGLLAEKYGFALKDVELVPLQSLSNAAAALKGGRTDAALLPITVARPLIDAGDARLLGWVGDETPWQLGAVFASPRMAGDADAMQRFLDAYRGGTPTITTCCWRPCRTAKRRARPRPSRCSPASRTTPAWRPRRWRSACPSSSATAGSTWRASPTNCAGTRRKATSMPASSSTT
jgi:NitT/TauT family transport system substrate-binding protein